MERYVELADAGDEVCNVLEVFGLATAVKRVIIVMLTFPSLVYQPFQRAFCIRQILDCPEVYLKILFFPP